MATFKDHFSRQATAYGRFRPGYPPELIDYVASLVPAHGLAIDCATGNGQAAVALARHFGRVVAVDGSVQQLAQAQPADGVTYVAALAEGLPLVTGCAALVAAAQAAHWFDFGRFYAECRRVLRPRGIVAVWTYEKFHAGPAVNAIVEHFYREVVGPYWPPERRYVESGYRDLPFPFDELPARPFALAIDWDLDHVMGYLSSWSATQRCRDATGADPLPALRLALGPHWEGRKRRLTWPLHLRVGRV